MLKRCFMSVSEELDRVETYWGGSWFPKGSTSVDVETLGLMNEHGVQRNIRKPFVGKPASF